MNGIILYTLEKIDIIGANRPALLLINNPSTSNMVYSFKWGYTTIGVLKNNLLKLFLESICDLGPQNQSYGSMFETEIYTSSES